MRFMRPHPLTDYKAKAMPHGSCPVQPVFFPVFRHFPPCLYSIPEHSDPVNVRGADKRDWFFVAFPVFSGLFFQSSGFGTKIANINWQIGDFAEGSNTVQTSPFRSARQSPRSLCPEQGLPVFKKPCKGQLK